MRLAMKKDVFIRIKGIHTVEAIADETEIIIPGTYYYRDGKHFVCYEEANEQTGEMAKSMLKMTNNTVEMIKRGSNAAHLFFEKNRKYYTRMNTEAGILELAMDTRDVTVTGTEEEEIIEAVISYVLEINEQKVSNCKVGITISSEYIM